MRKMTFPPRRKCGKRQNQRFRHGRSIFSNQFLFFIMMINPNRSIDRGVVLLSKNMSFPTANDRLGVNLGTIFASNKHKKYVSIMKRILPFMTVAVGILSSCSTTLTSFYTEDVNTYNREWQIQRRETYSRETSRLPHNRTAVSVCRQVLAQNQNKQKAQNSLISIHSMSMPGQNHKQYKWK